MLRWQVPERLVEKKRKWDDALVGLPHHLGHTGNNGDTWHGHTHGIFTFLGERIATETLPLVLAVLGKTPGEALHLPTSHCRPHATREKTAAAVRIALCPPEEKSGLSQRNP